jgi:hypothetical protein
MNEAAIKCPLCNRQFWIRERQGSPQATHRLPPHSNGTRRCPDKGSVAIVFDRRYRASVG